MKRPRTQRSRPGHKHYYDFTNPAYYSCARKKSYVYERIAERTATEMSEVTNRPLFTYKCDYCSNYHLTHFHKRSH